MLMLSFIYRKKGQMLSRLISRSDKCLPFFRFAKETQAGLTLIECLVAISVIAASMGVIAPVTVLAVATRVQNQRAEQAVHIARAEVDRVRLIVERDKNYKAKLNEIVALSAETSLNDVLPPDTASNSPSMPLATSVARKVKGNEGFSVQVFRSTNANGLAADGTPLAFKLGVRVYRTKAIDDYSVSQLSKEPASLTMTSGEGSATTRPLAVLETTVVKSDEKKSLCDYRKYSGNDMTIGACAL